MNVWAPLERVLAIASAAERRTRSDDLVGEITDGLATAGQYVSRIDLLPSEQVVDFNWAAHRAARRLGIRIQVDVHVPRQALHGRAEVRVTPQRPPH